MINLTLILLLGVLLLFWFVTHQKIAQNLPDSELKRRALLTSPEQMLYNRLHDILPNSQVMAHVSFDALLTTKFDRTRRKYQNMMADFVILDVNFCVVAVVGLSDSFHSRRQVQERYQDQLLELAGYQVLRYVGVPEYAQLRQDFKAHTALQARPVISIVHTPKTVMWARSSRQKIPQMF